MIDSILKRVFLILALVGVEAYSGENSLFLVVSDAGYFYQDHKIDSLEDLGEILLDLPEVNLQVCPCSDTRLVNDAVSYISGHRIEKINMSHISTNEDVIRFCSQC